MTAPMVGGRVTAEVNVDMLHVYLSQPGNLVRRGTVRSLTLTSARDVMRDVEGVRTRSGVFSVLVWPVGC